MTRIPVLPALFALLSILALSCTTLSPTASPLPVKVEIENKGTASERPEPAWLLPATDGSLRVSATLPGYPKTIVFVATADALNRETAELLAGKQELPAEFMRVIVAKARKALDAATTGIFEKPAFRRLANRFLALLGETAFSGLRREDDWWMRVQTSGFLGIPNPPVYRVYVLASMDEAIVARQVGSVLDRFDENLTPLEKNTRLPGLVRSAVGQAFGF